MQLKFTSILVAITSGALALAAITSGALALAADSVTYHTYSSTNSCSGSSFGTTDGGAVCYAIPAAYGYSIQFDNLPGGTQGQGYTGSTCGDFLFALYGPGTKCWNGGGTRATHFNWFHSPYGRRSAIGARADTNCSQPAFFTYTDNTGAERSIKVPAGDEDAAEVIAKLFEDQAFDSLAAYEKYES